MFNVAILRLKDLFKILAGSIFIILFITILWNGILSKKEALKNNNKIDILPKTSMLGALEEAMPVAKNINQEYRKVAKEDDHKEEKNILKAMLETQMSSAKALDDMEERKIQDENKNENLAAKEENKDNKDKNNNENQENAIATAGIATQIITQNPIKEKTNAQYGKVKIKNETEYALTEEMLKPDITIENRNVIIFHTHSCESYTSSEKFPYTPTGNYRTTDLNYTVTRVGTELENELKKYNYNVIHSTEYHDYPSYNGSYTKSLKTVENITKNNPSDIIIDLHRDAIGSRSDYAPTVKIGEEEAAQIMFVIGTNNGGLWHPNWNQNLKFAVKVQEKAEEMYPGLFKNIMLTKSRYNQHTGKFANIIEVGATGNTLEQCLTSMKYLAKVMGEL